MASPVPNSITTSSFTQSLIAKSGLPSPLNSPTTIPRACTSITGFGNRSPVAAALDSAGSSRSSGTTKTVPLRTIAFTSTCISHLQQGARFLEGCLSSTIRHAEGQGESCLTRGRVCAGTGRAAICLTAAQSGWMCGDKRKVLEDRDPAMCGNQGGFEVLQDLNTWRDRSVV